MPSDAFLLSDYAALELTITAGRDGSIQRVVISKPSKAKLYDEYTRKWVEDRWKMPVAKPGQPEMRKFIAPIVYPKSEKPAGHFPPPPYPGAYLMARVEGLVILHIFVAPSGKIEDVQVRLSSGNNGLDRYTANWVREQWRFPPGKPRWIQWPVAYRIL